METEGRGPEAARDQTSRGEGQAAAAGRGGAPAVLTCDEMRRVALEEMALRRRRLGELTPAQEQALESLLVTVADNISDMVSVVATRAPLPGRGEVRRASPGCAAAGEARGKVLGLARHPGVKFGAPLAAQERPRPEVDVPSHTAPHESAQKRVGDPPA